MAPAFTVRSLDLRPRLKSGSKKIVKPIRALYRKVVLEVVFPPLPEEAKDSKACDSSSASSPSSSQTSRKHAGGNAEIYCSICASRSAGDAESDIPALCPTPPSPASIASMSEASTSVGQDHTAVSQNDGTISTTSSLSLAASSPAETRKPSTIPSLDTLSEQQQSALVHAYAAHIEEDYAHIIPWSERRTHLQHFLSHHWPFETEDFTRVYFALMGRNLCEVREFSKWEVRVRLNEETAVEWGGTEQKWNRNFRTPKRGVVCFGVHRRQELLFNGWQWPEEKRARAEFAEEVGPMEERLEMVVEPPAGIDWASLTQQQAKVPPAPFEDRAPTYWPKWEKADFEVDVVRPLAVALWKAAKSIYLHAFFFGYQYNWKAAAMRLEEAYPQGGKVDWKKFKRAYKRFEGDNLAVNFAVDRQARAQLIMEMDRSLWSRMWH
ncbi:hypothetical protein BDY17DRAFT_323531 [Neohortaea acidophila]|uniref:Uncharacterized protein n=1 Tax=Neohortaea acidophila TaxID=245834 RepID=A0A6A6PXF5_9PEZI|nr:uncharacterized protein BDY17DRAFT_323531 [Neohortaea acidophila]KAF2484695.1 hypothetical protein BDY17DRAFT_323531 [Neohortaea acidophila]